MPHLRRRPGQAARRHPAAEARPAPPATLATVAELEPVEHGPDHRRPLLTCRLRETDAALLDPDVDTRHRDLRQPVRSSCHSQTNTGRGSEVKRHYLRLSVGDNEDECGASASSGFDGSGRRDPR